MVSPRSLGIGIEERINMSDINKDAYFAFLQELQDWGVQDISKAGPYLQEKFPELDMVTSRKVLQEWMQTRRQLLNEG